MNLMSRILSWLFPDPPTVTPPTRRLRATCDQCGKSIAVIASTGQLWRHRCDPEIAPMVPAANAAVEHVRGFTDDAA